MDELKATGKGQSKIRPAHNSHVAGQKTTAVARENVTKKMQGSGDPTKATSSPQTALNDQRVLYQPQLDGKLTLTTKLADSRMINTNLKKEVANLKLQAAQDAEKLKDAEAKISKMNSSLIEERNRTMRAYKDRDKLWTKSSQQGDDQIAVMTEMLKLKTDLSKTEASLRAAVTKEVGLERKEQQMETSLNLAHQAKFRSDLRLAERDRMIHELQEKLDMQLITASQLQSASRRFQEQSRVDRQTLDTVRAKLSTEQNTARRVQEEKTAEQSKNVRLCIDLNEAQREYRLELGNSDRLRQSLNVEVSQRMALIRSLAAEEQRTMDISGQLERNEDVCRDRIRELTIKHHEYVQVRSKLLDGKSAMFDLQEENMKLKRLCDDANRRTITAEGRAVELETAGTAREIALNQIQEQYRHTLRYIRVYEGSLAPDVERAIGKIASVLKEAKLPDIVSPAVIDKQWLAWDIAASDDSSRFVPTERAVLEILLSLVATPSKTVDVDAALRSMECICHNRRQLSSSLFGDQAQLLRACLTLAVENLNHSFQSIARHFDRLKALLLALLMIQHLLFAATTHGDLVWLTPIHDNVQQLIHTFPHSGMLLRISKTLASCLRGDFIRNTSIDLLQDFRVLDENHLIHANDEHIVHTVAGSGFYSIIPCAQVLVTTARPELKLRMDPKRRTDTRILQVSTLPALTIPQAATDLRSYFQKSLIRMGCEHGGTVMG